MEAGFFALVQNGPEAHPATCTVGMVCLSLGGHWPLPPH